MIKVIVFDFDDTLKVSEHIKQEGFIKIFAGIPKALPIVKSYVQDHYSLPRYDMIKGELIELKKEHIISYEDLEVATAERVKKYSELLERQVVVAPNVAGAIEALEDLSKNFKLYINTVTPQSAIEEIVKKLGWEKYFSGIYGHPPSTKLDNLKKIMETEGVTPAEVVVIGDGPSDLKVAKICGTYFIGVRGEFNQWPKVVDFPILDNLIDLPEVISKFNRSRIR